MKVKCHQVSSAGPVRDHNEDFLTFWEPDDFDLRQKIGSIALLADGVGGESNGDVASRLATETALGIFRDASPESPVRDVVRGMFDTAAAQVFQAAQQKGRMATTLLASVFRHDKLTIAHVGDSRAYLVRAGRIKRLTTDHSYTALQVKLGLLLERNAMTSPHRSTLTRSIGYEPMCHYDISIEPLQKGDFIVQCSDGLYGSMLDDEILDAVVKYHPGEACKRLIALAEKRQVSDNVSVQIVQVWEVDQPRMPVRHPPPAAAPSAPISLSATSSTRDSRLPMSSPKVAWPPCSRPLTVKPRGVAALKVPYLQIESDPAGFDRFKREEEIGLNLDHPYILKIIPVENKSRPYIAMEYPEGQTLSELLKNVHPLPEPDAVRIASRVCEALQYMHLKGVVHRDLKPQNIMVCNDGSLRIMGGGGVAVVAAALVWRCVVVGFCGGVGVDWFFFLGVCGGGGGGGGGFFIKI